jgi:glycerophosphoryl diester phosphodiesterase
MFYESRPAFNKLKDSGKSIEAIKLAVKQARQTRLPGFLFNAGWITPEIVHVAHLHGLAVNVWDVNSTGTLEKMLKAGVDGVMTDDPKMILTSI